MSKQNKNFLIRLLIWICIIFLSLVGLFSLLLFTMGIFERIFSMAVCGFIVLSMSIFGIFISAKSLAKYSIETTSGQMEQYKSYLKKEHEYKDMEKQSKRTESNDDNVKYVLKGANGQLYVYENKIEITRKGVLAFAHQGLKGVKTIPISEIKSIQVKKSGMVQGYIQFGISGSIENQGGYQAANNDENTVTFFNASCNQIALNIKSYIEDIIVNKPNSQNTIIQQSYSGADELKKYKDLLDDGVISQEEFDAKKKQILGL